MTILSLAWQESSHNINIFNPILIAIWPVTQLKTHWWSQKTIEPISCDGNGLNRLQIYITHLYHVLYIYYSLPYKCKMIYNDVLVQTKHMKTVYKPFYHQQVGRLTPSTRNTFPSCVSGSWIFCQNQAGLLPWFVAEYSRTTDCQLGLFVLHLISGWHWLRQLWTDLIGPHVDWLTWLRHMRTENCKILRNSRKSMKISSLKHIWNIQINCLY